MVLIWCSNGPKAQTLAPSQPSSHVWHKQHDNMSTKPWEVVLCQCVQLSAASIIYKCIIDNYQMTHKSVTSDTWIWDKLDQNNIEEGDDWAAWRAVTDSSAERRQTARCRRRPINAWHRTPVDTSLYISRLYTAISKPAVVQRHRLYEDVTRADAWVTKYTSSVYVIRYSAAILSDGRWVMKWMLTSLGMYLVHAPAASIALRHSKRTTTT